MTDRQGLVEGLLRRAPDPFASADPEIRRLIGELDALNAMVRPDPAFRTELRAQLVAVTPRIVGEADVEAAAPGNATPARRSPVRVLAAVVAMVLVLGTAFGVTVWRSRATLPGDSLYGLKRASEGWQLDLDRSRSAEALDYLHFAQSRAAEVKALLAHPQAEAGPRASAAGIDTRTVALVGKALAAADSDTRAGLRLLGAEVVSAHSAAALTPMTTWGPAQLGRLQLLAKHSGSSAVSARAARSVGVMVSVWNRTLAWEKTPDLHCLSNARTDDLGPLPCS